MRGEGNHKIPGSFAPENMEKTGAERVKYSLACQHEDAISIKFVSYAQKCPTVLCTFAVALRKESVDRNARALSPCMILSVALRKESVDRNYKTLAHILADRVALRKESVDRNMGLTHNGQHGQLSLSARRAWIEIAVRSSPSSLFSVALRKESVDRNGENSPPKTPPRASLSARRAWIEILHRLDYVLLAIRRSPQGERG